MRTIAIRSYNANVSPLTWQYVYNRWINEGIGPQRQVFRREPDRDELAFSRLCADLWNSPIVHWD